MDLYLPIGIIYYIYLSFFLHTFISLLFLYVIPFGELSFQGFHQNELRSSYRKRKATRGLKKTRNLSWRSM